MPTDTFAWLLHPLSARTFEADYFESKVCVVRRQSGRYYEHLTSLSDLDLLLSTRSARHPDVTVVNASQEIAMSEFADDLGVLDPVRAARLFAAGSTIIFGQMQTRLRALARLCADVGEHLSTRLQTNLYLTPSDSQGFPPHWDTHDVFVLQVFGSKSWTLYENTVELPFRGQHFSATEHPPGAVAEEFVLEAGDVAYIPRGVVHSARSSHEHSLHITLGLLSYTWADLFLECVAASAVDDVELRKSLPLGFARDDFSPSDRQQLFNEKLSMLTARLGADRAFDSLAQDLVRRPGQAFDNLLGQVAQVDTLTRSSVVRCRAHTSWNVREEHDRCIIVQGGREIRMPPHMLPAVRFARRSTAFTSQDLPDCVDAEGKLTLVRRLVVEGILECPEFVRLAN